MQVPGTTVPWYQYRSMEPYRRYQQVPLTGDSYRIVYMKIFLRAPASPRAARPPRPTSVPIKHRNRNLKNSGLKPNFFILNSSNYYFGRRPDPVTTSNLKKNPVTASGMTRKPRARATALYSTQAQARRIFTALPQSRWCPYLHHIQLEVRCGRRCYVLPSPSVLDWEIIQPRP